MKIFIISELQQVGQVFGVGDPNRVIYTSDTIVVSVVCVESRCVGSDGTRNAGVSCVALLI